jgi:hypothetical protein
VTPFSDGDFTAGGQSELAAFETLQPRGSVRAATEIL